MATIPGGYPDASNTGVSAGTALKVHNGDLVINTPGTVISGLDIRGTVYINAPNVTIENCKVTSSNNWCINVKTGVTGTVVQDCTIDGTGKGPMGQHGIAGSGTFLRNNIFNAENGINVEGSNTIIKDNYIHDLRASGADPHYDGVQVSGGFNNVSILHNTIIGRDTSCVFIVNDFGAMNNIVVDGNLLLGQDAGYTIYVLEKAGNPAQITNVQVTNNVLGSGYYGFASVERTEPTWSGNADIATGRSVTSNGALGGLPTTSSPAPSTPSVPTIDSFAGDSGVVGDHITNDNTVTLKGKAAANSTVKVFDNAKQVGTATADSKGAWTYTSATLADGTHKFTATATSSGVTSAASAAFSVAVDTVAPTAPTIKMSTSAATLASTHVAQLTGTAEANSAVNVFDGSSQIGTATANSSGAWTFTTQSLANGGHNFTARATDAAGNTGAASTALAVTIATDAQGAPPTTSPTPTPGKVIESAGATSLVESGDKYYLKSSSGSGPSLKYQGVDFVDGTDGTWAPIAAEKTTTGYQVVWKEASTGLYTAWNTDNNGNYVSHVSSLTGSTSDGTVSGRSFGFKSLETSFQQDLNGDGQIGTSSSGARTSSTPAPDKVIESSGAAGKVIESAGATSLVEKGDKYYLNSSSGSGPSLKYQGVDFVDGTDGTWAPIAAEKTTTGYQVVWKEASTGLYTAWNTDNNGNYVSHVSSLTGSTSDGTVSGRSSGFKSLETSFQQDLNGDGQIGTSGATALTQVSSTDQAVATSGKTIVGTDRSDTLISTSGNDIMTGKEGADTFVFAANFGHDVITDFTARGSSHDTIQFNKSVFDSFASVLSHASQSGNDVVIAADHGDSLTLKNMKLAALDKWDFHFV